MPYLIGRDDRAPHQRRRTYVPASGAKYRRYVLLVFFGRHATSAPWRPVDDATRMFSHRADKGTPVASPAMKPMRFAGKGLGSSKISLYGLSVEILGILGYRVLDF
jgi:hypothetical protein